MKLKSCFLFMCMMLIMLACSGNDDPVDQPKTPIVPDATLALSVGATDGVKANDGTENTEGDGTIRSLTAFVFNNDESGTYTANGYKIGEVVYTVTANITSPGATATLSGIGLASDKVKIFLVANLTDDQIGELKSNTDRSSIINSVTELQDEVDYTAEGGRGLTLSKEIDFDLQPGDNQVTIELERIVSRVELNSLSLKSSSEYASISFVPKEVFLTNVKSLAHLIGSEAVGSDVLGDSYWTGDIAANSSDGSFADGEYKTGNEKYVASLKTTISNLTINVKNTATSEDLAAKGNTYFYVYPNQTGETNDTSKKNYTLLVVKGDYTHQVNGINRTETDRYYMVVVNDDRFNAGGGEGVDNSHIKRNTKYWIDLTIAGSGSDKPYDPAAFAHISAKFHVTDWTVKNITGTVD